MHMNFFKGLLKLHVLSTNVVNQIKILQHTLCVTSPQLWPFKNISKINVYVPASSLTDTKMLFTLT